MNGKSLPVGAGIDGDEWPALTPLMAAAHKSHLELVQWLTGNGGSVTEQTNDGEPPFWIRPTTAISQLSC